MKTKNKKFSEGVYEVKKFFKKLFNTAIICVFFAIVLLGVLFFFIQKDLPSTAELKNYNPSIITNVYSDNGAKIGEFYNERRIVVPIGEMPKYLPKAFIAAEDSRFYQHKGVDFKSIIRAFTKNMKAGRIVQGGSTITQQVARTFFLNRKKKYIRKIREAILAYKLSDETHFTKDYILNLYLNQLYLGHRSYGVASAAENYFQKKVKDLNIAESAMLAGLPQAPSRYSPFKHMDKAKKRQKYVLKRMLEDGHISRQAYDKALKTEIIVKAVRNFYQEEVPYFTEYVRQYVEEKYGKKALYENGLQVYTTVNVAMQKFAKKAIKKGLKNLDKRHGFRGAVANINEKEIFKFINAKKETTIKKIETSSIENIKKFTIKKGEIFIGVVTNINDNKGLVTVRFKETIGHIKLKDMNWARKPNIAIPYWKGKIKKPSIALKRGDLVYIKIKSFNKTTKSYKLVLDQKPVVQSALLCIEAETGHVKAMMGGRKFVKSQFNRALQSRRQPGSAFKPILYSAALDKRYTVASIIIDSPIVFKDRIKDFTWKPKNYKETFFGPIRLRDAIVHSRNIVSIKILMDIGVDYVIKYSKLLGINSKINRDLSIALGSSGMSLMEIVRAYSVFANQGDYIEPIFITKITDKDGNILEENKPRRKRVIEESTAYIVTSMLESVVKEGTGWRIKALRKTAAGKTGTTNDLFDAWFIGYTPHYITGVWTGFDAMKSLGAGETGSRSAAPIWLDFMKNSLKNSPDEPFKISKNIVYTKIDERTGLLPNSDSKKVRTECFKEGTAPVEYTKKQNVITKEEDLFKESF